MRKKTWFEVLFLEEGIKWPGVEGLRPEMYRIRGGPLPSSEFPFVCDVYGMFREIPEGMEEWFERPMRSLDVILVCQEQARNKPLTCVPRLLISRADALRYGVNKLDNTKYQLAHVGCSDEHYTMPMNEIFEWSSRTKITK